MPSDPKAAMALASYAESLRLAFLAQTLAFMAVLEPRISLTDGFLGVVGQPPGGDMPVTVDASDGASALRFSMRQIEQQMRALAQKDLQQDLFAAPMLFGALHLGNRIIRGGFLKPDVPVLQFAKHFRNAAAHGDVWYFDNNEPRHPAKVRTLTVTRERLGQRATWETVKPGDYLGYLDEVEAHFMELAIEEAAKTVFRAHRGKPANEVLPLLHREFETRGIPIQNVEFGQQIAKMAIAVENGERYVPRVDPRVYPPAQ